MSASEEHIPARGEAPADTDPLEPGEQGQEQPPRPEDPTETKTPGTPVAPAEGTDQPKPQPVAPQRGL